MNLPLYIARRYLFARKSRNAINIISGISVAGVAVGTMALIVVLSVFNGFDGLIRQLYNSFDPELLILPVEGKTFIPESPAFDLVKTHPGVMHCAESLEENALLKYGDKQYIATVKGVDDNYRMVTGVDTMVVDGQYKLWDKNYPQAVVGMGVAYYLSMGLNFLNPISIFVIKRTGNFSMNPESAITRKHIFPSGVFSIEQEINSKYILVPIEFARELLMYKNEVSSLEIKVQPDYDVETVQDELKSILGNDFLIKTRNEQNELFYRIMRSEKWAIFFILSFILVIASFNIIGSLTMLILDKKDDIDTLHKLGATDSLIKRIFLLEGWLISFSGAVTGLIMGSLISWLQAEYGIIKLSGSGTFIIDAYPVVLQAGDVIAIFFTVTAIGFITAWVPVRYISKKWDQLRPS